MAEGTEIVVIGYHINDFYMNIYSEARAEYYDMFAFPHVVVDGTQAFEYSYDDLLEDYENRISVASNYSISIEVERYATDVSATVNVGQISAPNPETKVLHLVLTESHIPKTWYGGDEVNHAERLMIPDHNGTPIESAKSIFDFEFEMDPSWLVQNCELVAFIQDTITKEVKQAQVLSLEGTVLYNDVALIDILNPSNGFCQENISPVILLENYGADSLTSCLITYNVNGETNEYNWEGNLTTYQSEVVILPEINFVLEDNNSIIVELSQPNGEEDENQVDNTIDKSFSISQSIANQNLILELKTDYFGSETSWDLKNSLGNLVYSGDGYEDSTLYTINLDLLADDCYTFTMYDEGGNGICCNNGFGYYRIKDNDGLIYFLGGGFGDLDISSFQVDIETSENNINSDDAFSVFPNPVSDLIQIQSDAIISNIEIINLHGYVIMADKNVNAKIHFQDFSDFQSGVYFIRVQTKHGWFMNKVMKK